MVYNRIQVAFGALKKIRGPAINYQYDVKQILVINGLDLPEYYVVDFCNEGDATVIPMTGTSDGVEIPDSLLQTGKPVKAYIVVSSGQGDIQTRYEVKLPVNTRPMRDDVHPTDSQQQQIDALVDALNDGVSRAEEAADLLKNASAEAETLEPGSPASAEYEDGVFRFGVPKGDKGDPFTYEDFTEEEKQELIQGPILDAQNVAVGAVNAAGTTQVGNVNTAGEAQVRAVENKGEEVLASIPADYTETVNSIDDITSIGEYLDLSTVEMTVGSYLKPSGEIGQNDAFMLSDFIELPEGVNTITVNRDVYTSNGQKYPQNNMVFWYDAEKVYKGTGSNTFSDNLLTSAPSNWFGYKYVRINFSRYKVHNFVKFGYYYDLKYKTHLASVDLNDITDPGVYIIPNADNITNKPVMSAQLAFLIVNVAPFNDYKSQMLITRYGQYTRATNVNGVWSEWIHSDFGSNGVSLQSTTITDLNDLIPNRIYLLSNNSSNFSNLPYTGFLGTIMTFSGAGANGSGNSQMAISSTNRLFVRRSWGANATWNNWTEFTNPDFAKEITGELFAFTGAFESARQQLNTQFIMQPNTSYVVRFYNYRTGIINVFGINKTSNYKRVHPWTDSVRITNDGTARYLILYNPNGELFNVAIKVFTDDSIALKAESVPKVYRVKKIAENGDYTSLSKCLIDLKDDESPKVIEVWEGDYDLYAEYVELYNDGLLEIYTGDNPSMEYFPYCVWVPKNTHIIGKGIVRLKWMPDPATDSITPVQCRCISPLNVAATATIENVEVYCKNGRYCLHNDGLGKPEFTGAVQKYINVKFYKYPNDTDPVSGSEYGFKQTTGFGIDRSMHHIFDNCAFYNYAGGRAFYGHSRGSVGGTTLTEAMCSDITLTNCIFDSNCGRTGLLVKFGNGSNANLHIPVLFSDCYFSDGWISLQNESSSAQTTAPNAFDVTFVNCGKYKINVADPDNRYPPKSYDNLLPKVSNLSASSSGKAGQIAYDSNYVYICIADNTWKRAALETW